MAAEMRANRRSNRVQASTSSPGLTFVVFLTLVVLRIANAFTIQTFFQPDEYFQSLEPAWEMAFGSDSGAWITWEWHQRLRSSLHPMLFAVIYRAASQLGDFLQANASTRASLLLAAPKVMQALIAAVGDLYTWQLAGQLYGLNCRASHAALALTALSPWQFFCSVRTFSNSLETTLTVVGLYYWPWDWFVDQDSSGAKVTPTPRKDPSEDAKEHVQQFKKFLEGGGSKSATSNRVGSSRHRLAVASNDFYIALTAAASACILRPTNVIIWANISVCLLYRYGDEVKATAITQAVLLCGSAILVVSVGADKAYYGEWTLPPLNFLYFNVVNALSSFYGVNRVDYYFTEGLPLLLTTSLPFAITGLWQSLRPGVDKPTFKGYEERQTRLVVALAALVTIMAFTMLAHKEARFIYPLLPILHVLAAKPVAAFFQPLPMPSSKVKLGVLALMLTLNIYIAAYVSLVHQRGIIDVMHYLRHEQEVRLASHRQPANMTVGFFMPCHSTPWRSHLIYPETKAWALTCEPPLNLTLEQRQYYQDEADVFYAHPGSWIDESMQDRKTIMKKKTINVQAREGDEERRKWPEYLVFFEHLEPVMNSVLVGTRYQECWRGFNTHWHDDWRRQGDVVVWCLVDERTALFVFPISGETHRTE